MPRPTPTPSPTTSPGELAELIEQASEPAVPVGDYHQALESPYCRIGVYTTPRIATVVAGGEIDLDVVDEFDRTLTRAATSSTHVVLDLHDITFCGSTAFSLFIRHTKAMTHATTQRKLVIVANSDIVLRPIRLLKIDELLTITGSLPDAYHLIAALD